MTTRVADLRLLLIDPELGPHGLGRLAAGLPACRVWPAAQVASMQAVLQADATLTEIQADGVRAELAVGHGSGATVAAQLLASGLARRVVLIDPLDHLTHDAEFERAYRIDNPPPGPTKEEPIAQNLARIKAAIRALRAGELVTYYRWVADTTSDLPEIRDAYVAALTAADAPRQPYDEALALSSERWAELDWLSTLRRVPGEAVEIWWTRRPGGHQLLLSAAHLRHELPDARVLLRDWDRYDFLVHPEPWARALRAR